MNYTEFLLRISFSLVLGFIIGLERQLTGHSAGILVDSNLILCLLDRKLKPITVGKPKNIF